MHPTLKMDTTHIPELSARCHNSKHSHGEKPASTACNCASVLPQLAVMDEDARFARQQWLQTASYPWATYSDPDLRRQLQKLSVLGYAALQPHKFGKVKCQAN
jgi:hypothetical protein